MVSRRRAVSGQRACIVRYQWNDKAVVREAEALVSSGYSVDVLTLRAPNVSGVSNQARSEVINDVRYVRLPLTKHRGSAITYALDWALWFLVCFAWFTKESFRQRFSYVQIDTLPDHQVFAALVPKLTGSRIGLFLKEPTEELYGALWGSARVAAVMGWLANRSIDFADLAFCVTEEHRATYVQRGVDPDKLTVILNSMPPFPKAARQRPATDGQFVVVCHGTIEERWGHNTIIDAALIALPSLPGLRVHLPGRGSGVDLLAARIERMGLTDVVLLDGWLSDDDLAQLLADSDAGVVAQVASPYSHLVHTTKMYDYMEAAVPVIATRLGATEALFPDEISFVDSENAAQMAHAFVQLASDPERRERLASAALGRMADLGWKSQMDAMVGAIGTP